MVPLYNTIWYYKIGGRAVDGWLTVDEVSTQLKVHPETVRRWLREGRLDGRNFSGRAGWRVRVKEVQAFWDRQVPRGKSRPCAGQAGPGREVTPSPCSEQGGSIRKPSKAKHG